MSFSKSKLLVKIVNLCFLEPTVMVMVLLACDSVATNVFFNREKEISYFSILSDNHFGISLVKTFPGGRLEKWRDGYEVLIFIVSHFSHFLHLK